jgi:hypothetical protein
MKQKKTLKSFEELSVDSLSAADAESEKIKPPKPKAHPQAPRNTPQASHPQIPDVRGYQRWGINE